MPGSAPTGWQTPKTTWITSDAPTEIDMNRVERNTQAVELGNRTIDPAQAPTGSIGSLRNLLDWFANRIHAITGEATWVTNPVASLVTIWGKFHQANGHKHSGTENDAPKLPISAIDVGGATIWTSANDGTGSGLDADTLDGVHASAFAASYGPSDVVLATGTSGQVSSESFSRKTAIRVPVSGTYRIKFSLWNSSEDVGSTWGYLYIDGVATGNYGVANQGEWENFSFNVALNAGQTIELWCKVSDDNEYGAYNNFRVCGSPTPPQFVVVQ